MSLNRMAELGGVAVALGLMTIAVGGLGVAVAANGGSITIGQSNAATATTTLSDSHGTPLSLKAKHGKAPLQVNSSTEVKHFNAAEVGGSTASALKTSGSAIASDPFDVGKVGDINSTPTLIAETSKLKAGTYYVAAEASVFAPATADEPVGCLLSTSNLVGAKNVIPTVQTAETGVAGVQPITDIAPVKAKSGQRIGFYCELINGVKDGSTVYSVGLTAVLVNSSTAGRGFPSHELPFVRHSSREPGIHR